MYVVGTQKNCINDRVTLSIDMVTLSTHNVYLTLYLIEVPFNTSVNRADPDQAALVRAA